MAYFNQESDFSPVFFAHSLCNNYTWPRKKEEKNLDAENIYLNLFT